MQEPVNAVKGKLTVELDESLHRKAKSKSALEGASLASVVRGLLAEWVGLAEPERKNVSASSEASSAGAGHDRAASSGSASPIHALGEEESMPRTVAAFAPTRTVAAFAPVSQSKRVERCELRNPVVPSRKCRLEVGHAGAHSFS